MHRRHGQRRGRTVAVLSSAVWGGGALVPLWRSPAFIGGEGRGVAADVVIRGIVPPRVWPGGGVERAQCACAVTAGTRSHSAPSGGPASPHADPGPRGLRPHRRGA